MTNFSNDTNIRLSSVSSLETSSLGRLEFSSSKLTGSILPPMRTSGFFTSVMDLPKIYIGVSFCARSSISINDFILRHDLTEGSSLQDPSQGLPRGGEGCSSISWFRWSSVEFTDTALLLVLPKNNTTTNHHMVTSLPPPHCPFQLLSDTLISSTCRFFLPPTEKKSENSLSKSSLLSPLIASEAWRWSGWVYSYLTRQENGLFRLLVKKLFVVHWTFNVG